MNLHYLKYFYEVAKAGSVTEGARRLRISQPAISKMIHALEDELGCRLLERMPRGVRLTSEGNLAFARASRIFAEASMLREELGRSSPELRGSWTLGASDTLAIHMIPSILGRFKQEHPGLRIHLLAGISGHIKDQMLKDRCDLGLFFTPLKRDEPFEAEVCYETEFWIAASPSLLKRSMGKLARPHALKDLKALPRIESVHSDYSGGFPAHFHSHSLGMSEAPFLEVNSHEVKKKLILSGFGYALMVKESIEDEVKRGELVRVLTPKPLAAPVYRVSRRGRPLGRPSLEFMERFRAEVPKTKSAERRSTSSK